MREPFELASRQGELVHGWLVVPDKSVAAPRCVLLVHGVGGNKDSWWSNSNLAGPIAPRLVDAGYAVLALDATGLGRTARITRSQAHSPTRPSSWLYRAREIVDGTMADYREALDLLGRRKDIDLRGCAVLGYSFGGIVALRLLASESRLACGIVCVPPPVMEDQGIESEPALSSRVRSVGALSENGIEALSKKPLLFLMGSQDTYYSVEEATALVRRIPGPDKTLKFYESGHVLPPGYVEDALTWLRRHVAR